MSPDFAARSSHPIPDDFLRRWQTDVFLNAVANGAKTYRFSVAPNGSMLFEAWREELTYIPAPDFTTAAPV